jgi:ABC-type glycerol-3-phosphate transport system permease component
MLQRYVIHLILIFLFAFTQIGVAAHEISHLNDTNQHSQQNPKSQSKHTSAEQCSQCISYAKVANGLALSDFLIPEFNAVSTAVTAYALKTFTNTTTAYTARAPPQSANA